MKYIMARAATMRIKDIAKIKKSKNPSDSSSWSTYVETVILSS
jgi:hypothetical protein